MATQGNILIVDSDAYLTNLLSLNLREAGFGVKVLTSTEDFNIENVRDARLIIIDAMEQHPNGVQCITRLKASPVVNHIPCVLCSTAEGEDLIVQAFDAGADDYIIKPFSLRELIARVKAILRRHPLDIPEPEPVNTVLPVGNIHVDLASHRVTAQTGETIALTPTEFAILAFLLENRGKYFNRDRIFAHVWKSEDKGGTRIVDTNISRLRKKIGPEAAAHIVNRYGMGYALVDEVKQ